MDGAQLALSSIGQFDTRATPLQMAMVAGAVADDGTVMAPYLVDRETDSGGGTVSITRPRVLDRAMSARTASVLQGMMTDVVTDGTGTNAAIPGVDVGGKTGTAQHGVDNSGYAVRLVHLLGAARRRRRPRRSRSPWSSRTPPPTAPTSRAAAAPPRSRRP